MVLTDMPDKAWKKYLKIAHKLREPAVIVMTGLCGSGKSTLAKKLAKKFKAPTHTIGACRDIIKELYDKRHPEMKTCDLNNDVCMLLEMEAWSLFFYATLREIEMRHDVILDTSGLNKRLNFLLDNLWGCARVVRIKLMCPLRILKDRIKNRKQKQKGFFPYEYAGHMDLNKDLAKSIREVKANITINAAKLNKQQVYNKTIKELRKYGIK